jgi:hypothetical protein
MVRVSGHLVRWGYAFVAYASFTASHDLSRPVRHRNSGQRIATSIAAHHAAIRHDVD